MIFVIAVILYLFAAFLLWFFFTTTRFKDEKVVSVIVFLGLTAALMCLMIDLPAYIRKDNIVESPVSIEASGRRRGGRDYRLVYYDDSNRRYAAGWVSDSFAETYNGEPLRLTLLPTVGIVLKAEIQTVWRPALGNSPARMYPANEYREVVNYTEGMGLIVIVMVGTMVIMSTIHRVKNGRFIIKSNEKIAKLACRSCKLYYDMDSPKCPRCGRKNRHIN